MGWWWKSDPQTPVLKPSDPTPDPAPTSSQPPASARDIADIPTPITSRAMDQRNEQPDADLQAFLSELNASAAPTNTPSPTSTPAERAAARPHRAIYPTTMSCRQAFDSAFYCQSLGGQFNGVYRYGGLQDCSEHWSDFWFCMTIKGYPAHEKEEHVVERYRQKEERYRKGPSSEDVWDERKKGEELVDAFMRDPDEMDTPGVSKRPSGMKAS